MTALADLLRTATAPLAGAVVMAGQAIGRGVLRTTKMVGNRLQANRLAELDDRMLADMGLNRSDVRDAVFAPFWSDPTRLLAERVAGRRRARRTFRQPDNRHLPVIEAPSLGPDAEDTSTARVARLHVI
jgi:hypothetical protein